MQKAKRKIASKLSPKVGTKTHRIAKTVVCSLQNLVPRFWYCAASVHELTVAVLRSSTKQNDLGHQSNSLHSPP
jgi:hypothetical protein